MRVEHNEIATPKNAERTENPELASLRMAGPSPEQMNQMIEANTKRIADMQIDIATKFGSLNPELQKAVLEGLTPEMKQNSAKYPAYASIAA